MTGVADIEGQVMQTVREVLHAEVDSVDTDLLEGSVIDSLGFVELLYELQVRFDVEIAVDDLEIENFRTIHRIACFIHHLRSGPGQQTTLTT